MFTHGKKDMVIDSGLIREQYFADQGRGKRYCFDCRYVQLARDFDQSAARILLN
jgi:hypothetical protein